MNKLGCMTDLWLFSQLTPTEKRHLQSVTRKPTCKKGEMLFLEGDPATSLFLVTAGRVKLFKVSEEGKEIILGFLSPHDLFGEEVLVSTTTRSMSAVAMETTRLCVCEKSDFEGMIRKSPDFAMKVIQTLGEKLNQVTGQLVDFAMHNVRERVANVLTRLAKEYGEESQQGLHLNFRLTHEDLGALVGASRVMVTNVLQDLRKAGYISMDRKNRFIVNARLLEKTQTGIEEGKISISPLCPCFQETKQV